MIFSGGMIEPTDLSPMSRKPAGGTFPCPGVCQCCACFEQRSWSRDSWDASGGWLTFLRSLYRIAYHYCQTRNIALKPKGPRIPRRDTSRMLLGSCREHRMGATRFSVFIQRSKLGPCEYASSSETQYLPMKSRITT